MPVAKPEPAPAATKAEAKPDPGAAAPMVVEVSSKRGGLAAWLPVIAAVVLAPAATWATIEFVMLPRLQQKIAATPLPETSTPAASTPADDSAPNAKKKGKDVKDAGAPTYEGFQNVVVNLAGTMGTRYLKTSFIVTGSDPAIKTVFESAKPKLHDVTLNVLSSLTLADLEEPGAKNVIREKLVLAYNQALGKRVAEQVYFSDFVVQ